MELWLLGAGAIVLVGITLWIVWPARTADAVGKPTQGKEVFETPMIDNNERSGVTPPGQRVGDQYTSATADPSAGGVATAPDAAHTAPPGTTAPAAAATGRPPYTPLPPSQAWTPPPGLYDGGPEPRTIGLGAGALLSLGGALGGAWLYARWQRRRNQPINRLRRGAREMGSRIGERIPDVDELPTGAAPMSGAAAAMLLAGLLATRMLRHNSRDRAEQASDAVRDALEYGGREARKRGREVLDRGGREAMDRGRDVARQGRKSAERGGREALKRGRDVADRGRHRAQDFASTVSTDQLEESTRPARKRLGIIAMGVIGAGSYLVWRLMHPAGR